LCDVDGVDSAEAVLAVAASWALQLHSRLRIVTVYEPVGGRGGCSGTRTCLRVHSCAHTEPLRGADLAATLPGITAFFARAPEPHLAV
jgi:hypothetical protein